MGDCTGKSLAEEEAGVKRYRPQPADVDNNNARVPHSVFKDSDHHEKVSSILTNKNQRTRSNWWIFFVDVYVLLRVKRCYNIADDSWFWIVFVLKLYVS